jgi:hypothetical protein
MSDRISPRRHRDASGQREFHLYVATTGAVAFDIFSSAGGNKTAVTGAGAVSAGTWAFVLAWSDPVSDSLSVRVNNGTIFSTAAAGLVVNDSTTPFAIGARPFSGAQAYMDGKIDSVSFGKSPPGGIAGVISEISLRLYNSGAGREYPFS